MYANIVYDSGTTLTEVFDDSIALLTGETVVANLSGLTINAIPSFIDVSNSVAGWEIHSTITPSADVVIRAPLIDDATKYKYVRLFTVGGYINIEMWEFWNATTDVGTNKAYKDNTIKYFAFPSTTSQYTLNISASARHLLGYRSSDALGCFEHAREDAWNTVANGYPCFVQIEIDDNMWTLNSNLTACSVPRVVLPSGVEYINTTTARAYITSPFVIPSSTQSLKEFTGTSTGGSQVLDTNKVLAHALQPFSPRHHTYRLMFGDVSGLSNIYLASYATGTHGDTMVVDGNTYMIWAYGNARLAVLRG